MRKWYPWLIVAAVFAFTAAVFNRLPEQLPTHWNAQGEVNGWSGRMFGAWMIPVILAIIALVLPRLPAIDPKRTNYDKFRPTYDLVVNAVITLMGGLHVAMLGAGLGWPISIERVVPVMVGSLFLILGNVMPRARPNWIFGIRTPWTLTNDRVWERTHRLGGFLFVAAGIVLMLMAVLPPRVATPIVIGTIVISSVVPLVYSYFAWRQETSR